MKLLQSLGLVLLVYCATCKQAASQDLNKDDLIKLFYKGEYEKCLEVAGATLPGLSKPSKQHDICLFVLGGSNHYLGQFFEAQPLLNEYLSLYKGKDGDQSRLQAASYFQASNYSRLMELTKSAKLLDEFLKKYPNPEENPYIPYALFERVVCHYAEGEGQLALKKVAQIEAGFPDVEIMEQLLSMKGNIFESLGKSEEAEKSYLKGLRLAEQRKNDLVAGECLFYLVTLIGREEIGNEPNPRVAEAVPYYNQFWEKYGQDSPFSAKVAVAGLPGMRKVGKIDEALERLRAVIANLSKIPGDPGLEGAINSYTREYLKDHSLEQLKEHYFSSSGNHHDKATRALFRIAIIEACEGLLRFSSHHSDEKEIASARAIIGVLYKELQTDFALKDLSNFILVRVGDFVSRNHTDPQAAVIYYKEILSRPQNWQYKFPALFGLAEVYAMGSDAQKVEAIKLLKTVIEESDDASQREKALYLTASIHGQLGDHDAAITKAKAYLENRSYRRHKADCKMLLAVSLDKAGRFNNALMAYQNLWASNMGMIRISAPAILRWMELLWERNGRNGGKGDRQTAYENGHRYIKMTSKAVKRATPVERAKWDKVSELVSNYEAASDTKK